MTLEHESALKAAEMLLTDVWEQPIVLGDSETLDSQHVMLRCRAAPEGSGRPQTVILKQFKAANHDDQESSTRFLNEWANLRFLSELVTPIHLAPRLYAGDTNTRLMVIEDLADYDNLQEMLLIGDDARAAAEALRMYGAYLGKLHGVTAPHEGQRRHLCAELSAHAPESDSSTKLQTVLPWLHDCLETLKIAVPAGFDAAVLALTHQQHGEDNPFRTLTHCDAGPQNIFTNGRDVLLIDYEFAQFQHCLLDLVGGRLGFPSAWKGHRLPDDVLAGLETAYRSTLSDYLPQAADDSAYDTALVNACAHWALTRLGYLWNGYLRQRLVAGEAHDADFKPENLVKLRRQSVTVQRGFISAAREYRRLSLLRGVVETVLERLHGRWGDMDEQMPVYPVFQEKVGSQSE